jgi:NADH:ubiquinone oxidoreductase subunit E
MGDAPLDLEKVKQILENRGATIDSLIPIMQDIQHDFGYVPMEAVDFVAESLDCSPTKIFGILTFYSQFRLMPPGEHSLKVCQGTACHVMGGERILKYLSDKLDVKDGDTTKDGRYTFERVACVGCCGMAPVVLIDEKPHGNSSVISVDKLIDEDKGGE